MQASKLAQLFSQVLKSQFHLDSEIVLQPPTQKGRGDLATAVALQEYKNLSADLKGTFPNPKAWAEQLVEEFKKAVIASDFKKQIENIEVAGPGFINIIFAENTYGSVLTQSVKKITPTSNAGKTVVVEYSSPNIAKPFTVGHLRSTIIGSAVASILSATGAEVKRDNHLGDWGTQFGKQIYALMHLGEGSLEANIAKITAAENPVKELVQLYVEFHKVAEEKPELEDEGRQWFKKLEAGDKQARELWQLCIDWSLKEFQRIYKRLDISFTENPDNGFLGYGESFFEDKMQPVIDELRDKKLLTVGKNGAELVFFPNDELPPLMILKQDGATLYATRDLAADLYRRQTLGNDITIVNEVGAEQALYFQQIYLTEVLLGWFTTEQRVHVKHGLYRFKDKKMSTRKGNVIWLEDVLNEAQKRALAVSDDVATAEIVGIGALKWNDLKRSSHLDVVFDWDEILNLKGNSGPYLQYTVVRARSILSKASDQLSPALAQQLEFNPEEKLIVTLLSQFSAALERSAREYAPHHLCTYLYELAQAFNSFYNQHQVLSDKIEPAQKAVRLALTRQVELTLAYGLEILGIQIPDKM